MRCAFCESPEIQERIILKNSLVSAFPTNIPITPGHTLICPNRCIPKLSDLTADETLAIVEMVDIITAALKDAFGAKGFNFAWNEGETAGQNVPHFHLHVVPRKSGDTGVTNYEPREFLYRPGSRKDTPETELKEISRVIKASLKKEL